MDNKNGVLAGIDNGGVCGRFIHTKLKIKIIVHGDLLHWTNLLIMEK